MLKSVLMVSLIALTFTYTSVFAQQQCPKERPYLYKVSIKFTDISLESPSVSHLVFTDKSYTFIHVCHKKEIESENDYLMLSKNIDNNYTPSRKTLILSATKVD